MTTFLLITGATAAAFALLYLTLRIGAWCDGRDW